MRIILFTGKGGVGKSTNACATAALTAATGRKTLLVSSDLAHNLSDIFDVKDGSSKKRISGNLDILEVDIIEEIRKNWDSIQRYFANLFSYMGMDSLVAEEVALIPGIDALFLLTGILREIESKTYDVVIIDCAPTSGTLSLLTLTDAAGNKANRLIKIERNIFNLVRPISKRMKSVRNFVPDDEMFITVGKIVEDIGRLGIILKNHEVCSIRLVLNPDKIAIAESKRSYTYFSLFGFPVDAILVNKLFPVELKDGYFEKWRHLQQEQMKQLHQSFLDTRIISIRHYENEPIGVEHLEAMGKDIYRELDPAAVLSNVNTVTFKKQNGRIVLSIVLPGLNKASIDVGRKDNDLLISAEGYSRVLSLPDTLANVDIDRAEYDENRLNIHFAGKR
jgi:arsenite/tail-anchored protein-transporting ATPase